MTHPENMNLEEDLNFFEALRSTQGVEFASKPISLKNAIAYDLSDNEIQILLKNSCLVNDGESEAA